MGVQAASTLQPTPMKICVMLCLKMALGCTAFYSHYILNTINS